MTEGPQGGDRIDGRKFEVTTVRTEGAHTVHAVGEMDLSVTGDLDREMRQAESSDAKRIVLDLDQLDFLDAAGVHLLLDVTARSRANGGRLRIKRARAPQVRRVLELTGAGEILPFAA